jgi:hypothetical protein
MTTHIGLWIDHRKAILRQIASRSRSDCKTVRQSLDNRMVGDAGLEQVSPSRFQTSSLEKSPDPNGAISGAVQCDSAILADSDLARLVAAWPALADEIRAAILELIPGR